MVKFPTTLACVLVLFYIPYSEEIIHFLCAWHVTSQAYHFLFQKDACPHEH